MTRRPHRLIAVGYAPESSDRCAAVTVGRGRALTSRLRSDCSHTSSTNCSAAMTPVRGHLTLKASRGVATRRTSACRAAAGLRKRVSAREDKRCRQSQCCEFHDCSFFLPRNGQRGPLTLRSRWSITVRCCSRRFPRKSGIAAMLWTNRRRQSIFHATSQLKIVQLNLPRYQGH